VEDSATRQAGLAAALVALVAVVLLLRRRPHPVRQAKRGVGDAVHRGEEALVPPRHVDEEASIVADLVVDAAVSRLGSADRRRRRRG
jgi:hypothetical protein